MCVCVCVCVCVWVRERERERERAHVKQRKISQSAKLGDRQTHQQRQRMANVDIRWALGGKVVISSRFILARNLFGFFPWDLPVVKISPQWVTGPEQGKSSGRIAPFSLWTDMFRDGISSIPGETVVPLWLGRHFLVYENRVYHEKVRMTVG